MKDDMKVMASFFPTQLNEPRNGPGFIDWPRLATTFSASVLALSMFAK